MKKASCFLLVFVLLACFTVIPAMVTNTNQSAEYIRMMNRNASTDLDAVLFNPAGLARLADGTYLYLSSQTIWQSREVTATFPKYNRGTFKGDTFVPSFPNAYFVRKRGALALFAGFMPIGGGGSADFPKGLPSFDYQLARLVGFPATLLVPKGLDPDLADSVGTITGYAVDAAFTGSSIYFAGQTGVAYALNKALSLALGVRFVYASNTYVGELKNSVLKAQHGDIAGFIPDMAVDSKRTGSAYTAVLGLNFSPSEALNIGVRYEPITKLQVVAATAEDGTKGVIDETGMFPDGVKYDEDIPPQLGLGVSFQIAPRLRTEASFNYFMNTQCDWDGDEANVTNDFNAGIGFEFALNEALSLSSGYLYSTTGATPEYNTDLDFGLGSNSLGVGLRYALNPKTTLSLATSNTFYTEGHNDDLDTDFEERYQKTAFVIALGLQFKLK